jgi:hypothetical protein
LLVVFDSAIHNDVNRACSSMIDILVRRALCRS